ncbi:MAG: glycosyltransferase family 4 protein [Erythrobacter sp.]|jgi:glycosyltransferase involved in cell wall biosynthesis|nr:glycosyltransferase family 4 protein [Erythrobacter sp.]
MRVLHCLGARAGGGALAIAALDGVAEQYVAGHAPTKHYEITELSDFPGLSGWPNPARLYAMAQAMRGFDLILTHGWGAINASLARTAFAEPLGLPPLIHHEYATGEGSPRIARKWMRGAALRRAHSLVVPRPSFERIARDHWNQPPERIRMLPEAIDTVRFSRKPEPGAMRLVKRKGERWIAVVASGETPAALALLIEASTALPDHWHCVVLGSAERFDTVRAIAEDMNFAHRLHWPGEDIDRADVLGLFDLFAAPSATRPSYRNILEAMAAKLPVTVADTPDNRALVAQVNHAQLVVPGDVATLREALEMLAHDRGMRARLGTANREHVCARFDRAKVIAQYRALYREAWGTGAIDPPA